MENIIEQVTTELKERLERLENRERDFRERLKAADNPKDKIYFRISADFVAQQIRNLEGEFITKDEERNTLLKELIGFQKNLDEAQEQHKKAVERNHELLQEATRDECRYLEYILELGVKRYIDLLQ
jgi:chromosome segregation ATPase